MKIKSFLTILFLVMAVMPFSRCDDNDGPAKTEEQLYTERLSKTWNVSEVMLDDDEVTEFYSAMTLTIKNNHTYVNTNPVQNIWPGSGGFTLEKIAATGHFKMIRSDGMEIMITELTDSELNFTFQYNAPGGRTKGISGVYSFSMAAAN